MIAALKQAEAGRKVEDVAREVGVSKHTIYGWKAKYGGMDVNEVQEVKQLREENRATIRNSGIMSFYRLVSSKKSRFLHSRATMEK